MKNTILRTLTIALMVVALASFSQVFKTSLKLTVLNELGNPEASTQVQLYLTEDDYRNETNAVTEIFLTDEKGQVKIKDLENRVYYVSAVKGDKDNIGAAVMTDKLEPGKVNKVTIIIE